MVSGAGFGVDQGSVGTFSLPCFNRLVRTRMLGGVGRAGEMPALTRLGFICVAQDSEADYPLATIRIFSLV